ncbi:MAG TPA: hypothetical protein VNK41_00180 [Vicinamibacterales bacterium]|nr:hypothetical protein [Vicinamibacterales bacterium]
MGATDRFRSGLRWLATGLSVAAASYATYVGFRWYTYGSTKPPADGDQDPLLDRFMPVYEVAERHQIQVNAPPDVTFAAAREADLRRSGLTRAVLRSREVIMRSQSTGRTLPSGLLDMATALGWVILAEVPGREVVVGAVTQPWRADVEFHGVPPEQFADFQEPGYVKIAWTLRVDPVEGESGRSVFRTETRATTTDAASRAAFRRYWSLFSPGIVLIRRVSLGLIKTEAERRVGHSTAELAEEKPGARAGLTTPPRLGSG